MKSTAQDLSTTAIHDRILDAAAACLVEAGYGTRLHAVIAERAGLSRPTVYKYVGDQTEIVEALFRREITRFFAVLEPVLLDHDRFRDGFVECVVFSVGYARRHRVLQKGLRDEPAIVLSGFTVHAQPLVDRGGEVLAPHFARMLAADPSSTIDPRIASEWAFRLVASLVTTTGSVDTGDDDAVRAFVHGLLSLGAPQPV
ncbi:TetR/AcrR family transcriptional regulator [Prescottella subtropica]|uniref:TetR/AcrR family transcriptional regulator n=1 Tax=Prescottella subtropica TaxID=2545757 RepID=UPI0010F84D63|nr:TetR/AcrR family transcriptional regulator [Prescottella subtropica]